MDDLYASHATWMQRAIVIARRALPKDVPVGAILIDQDGQVLAEGYNRRELDNDPAGHAEIMVLQQAARKLGHWRLNNTILYVTLEPCPMCASAIQQARVGQVVFGAYDPVMGACGSKTGLLLDTPELPVLGGVLEAPCGDLLREFFSRLRNQQ